MLKLTVILWKKIIPRKAILPVSLYLYCRKPSYDEFGKPRVTTLICDRSQDIITDEDREFKDLVSGWFSNWCHFKNQYRWCWWRVTNVLKMSPTSMFCGHYTKLKSFSEIFKSKKWKSLEIWMAFPIFSPRSCMLLSNLWHINLSSSLNWHLYR